MERVDLQREIERLSDEDQPERAGDLAGIAEAFPGSWGVRSRWGDLRVCCSSANADAEYIELEHQCLEHDGRPLEGWIYAVVGRNDKIFCDPPYFIVADANVNGFGEVPRAGWKQEMIKAGINKIAIGRVERYLTMHPPVNYEESGE